MKTIATIWGDAPFQALNAKLQEFTEHEQTLLLPMRPSVGYTDGVDYLLEAADADWAVKAIAKQYTTPTWQDRLARDATLGERHCWRVSRLHDSGGQVLLEAYDARGRELGHRDYVERAGVAWDYLTVWGWWDTKYEHWVLGLASEVAGRPA